MTVSQDQPPENIVPVDVSTRAGFDAILAATAHARVVLLGEASHGDGATFVAKAALAQELHERGGVDALAWEAGSYDCWRMDRALGSGMEPMSALALGVHGIWVAEEVRPLAEYISRSWHTGRPYRQFGFDTQFSSVTSVDTIAADLRTLLGEIGIELGGGDAAAITAIARHSFVFFEHLGPDQHAVARSRIERLRDAAADRDPGGPAARFLTDVVDNDDVQPVLNAWIQERRAAEPPSELPDDDAGYKERFGMRDAAMARNLLADLERAPGTRFAGWLANGHAERNIDTLNEDDPRFTSLITMGGVLHDALGDQVYVLATTSFSGEMHDGGRAPATPLPPAAPGSLEQVLHDTGLPACFVDVRGLPADSPWRQRRTWRAWPPEQQTAALPDVVDGVLFLDRQHAAHPADAPTRFALARG